MNEITVTIPAQKFSVGKYIGYSDKCGPEFNGRCYLEDALYALGYTTARVYALGRMKIDGASYVTKERFGSTLLKNAFERGQSVTVTLIKQ